MCVFPALWGDCGELTTSITSLLQPTSHSFPAFSTLSLHFPASPCTLLSSPLSPLPRLSSHSPPQSSPLSTSSPLISPQLSRLTSPSESTSPFRATSSSPSCVMPITSSAPSSSPSSTMAGAGEPERASRTRTGTGTCTADVKGRSAVPPGPAPASVKSTSSSSISCGQKGREISWGRCECLCGGMNQMRPRDSYRMHWQHAHQVPSAVLWQLLSHLLSAPLSWLLSPREAPGRPRPRSHVGCRGHRASPPPRRAAPLVRCGIACRMRPWLTGTPRGPRTAIRKSRAPDRTRQGRGGTGIGQGGGEALLPPCYLQRTRDAASR